MDIVTISSIATSITTVSFAGIVYLLKRIIEISEENRKRKIQRLDERLKNFYWPLLFKIQRNEALALVISKKYSVVEEIPPHIKEEIIDNQKEAVKLIETNIYIAEPDDKLSNLIKKYTEYSLQCQLIFLSKNEASQLPDLKILSDFILLIKSKTEFYQKELDKITSGSINDFLKLKK